MHVFKLKKVTHYIIPSMKNIFYKDIARHIGKKYNTVKGYKSKSPKLLEILKLGTMCKENNVDITELKRLIKARDAYKETIEK